ncbi:MAG: DUF5367 family protein [Cyanobacteria bacterium P01_D01_bin.50]
MNIKNRITLVLTGFTMWAAATSVFRMSGSYFFEGSTAEYLINAISTVILYAVVSVGLMKLLRIEPSNWLEGAICIALPGMLGEIPILYSFSELMISMQPETAGRYAAFLFSGYVSLIGFTWLLSTKASSLLTSESK